MDKKKEAMDVVAVESEPKEKTWINSVNDMGQDISYHARDEYDTFLEKCLEPYGIKKFNAGFYKDRVRIEEESPHIDGFETFSYQRFYIDGEYAFTVVFKQRSIAWNESDTGLLLSYKKVIEQDRVSKGNLNMTNKEAIDILRSHQLFEVSPVTNEAFNLAIAALEYKDTIDKIVGSEPPVIIRNYSGLFDKED